MAISPQPPLPIYELAGQQSDPVAEEMLAVMFTDAPVRAELAGEDTRRHWQWFARDPKGQATTAWRSDGQPIDDDLPGEMESRFQEGLDDAFVPGFLPEVEVEVRQVATDSLVTTVTAERSRQQVTTVSILMPISG